jgi:nucleoside 2-deoxyribosyltransferase
MRIYYARPIFTPGEQAYNSTVEKMLEDAGFELPQWGSSLGRTRAQRIFDGCYAGIAPANALVAILTGTEVDDGTASEIGIFYALMQTDPTKSGIVGVHDDWRTDPHHRSFQGKGLNPFVEGCVLQGGHIVRSARGAVGRLNLWREQLVQDGLLGLEPRTSDQSGAGHARPLGVGADGQPVAKVYLTGPQYTPYARQFVEEYARQIQALGLQVYRPSVRFQLSDPPPTPQEIFAADYAELEGSNILVALLDGTQIDDAVAMELGLFYGLSLDDPSKKGIIGLVTDVRGLRWRENGFGSNHFPVGLIEYSGIITDDVDEALSQLCVWAEELTTLR